MPFLARPQSKLSIAFVVTVFSILAAFTIPANAYEIPTLQGDDPDAASTWIAGRNFISLGNQHSSTQGSCGGGTNPCPYSFYKTIEVTDLLTGKRNKHSFGCPEMPVGWQAHYAGIQNVVTSADGKTIFAIFGVTNQPLQEQKNTSTNSDPVCAELTQWATTTTPELIQTDYPDSPAGSKSLSGFRFLVRSDDDGSTWHFVPPPAALNMVSGTFIPGIQDSDVIWDTVTGIEKKVSDFIAYPTEHGIAYGSKLSGVALYKADTSTWSAVQPVDSTADLARTFLGFPNGDAPALKKYRKNRAFDSWRFTSKGQISVWAHAEEGARASSRAFWLTPDAKRIIANKRLRLPRKRLKIRFDDLMSICAPRKRTARPQDFGYVWLGNSTKMMWALTSGDVDVRCTSKRRPQWPNGVYRSGGGIKSMFVRSTNGGKTWRELKPGRALNGWSTYTVIGNSLIILSGNCKRPDGARGERIHRLNGSRWKTYGCV